MRRSHTYLTGGDARPFNECDDLPERWCERMTAWDETADAGDGCPLTGSAGLQKVGRKQAGRVARRSAGHFFCFIVKRADSALTKKWSRLSSSSGLFGAKRTPNPISSAL